MASFVGNFNYIFVLKSHSDQFIGTIVSLNLRPIYFNPFFGNLLKKNFLEFHSENSATPPKLTLPSNFCAVTLAVSRVLGKIWSI